MEQNSEYQKSSSPIEHHFNAVKQEDYSSTFNKTSDWLFKAGIQMENQKHSNERKINKMKSFFLAHKLRLVYTVILFAVIVGACNMPVTQTETAGQMITVTVPKNNTEFGTKLFSLPWIKSAQVTQNENTENGIEQVLYSIVLPNTSEDDVMKYYKELETLGGTSFIKVTPLNYDVKRPLYSAALHNFFSLNIDATGMSDEDLKHEIEAKMKEQGVDMKFDFKTIPDGRRELRIEHDQSKDADKDPKTFELNIDDNNGKEKIKLFTKKADPHQFEGKTDKEIRDMVRKETGNHDLKDDEIIITREGGKVQVKVEVHKNEVK